MLEHIEKMKEEHKELDIKIKALDAFIYSDPIFKTLIDIDQVSMCKQLAHMQCYARELAARIWRAG